MCRPRPSSRSRPAWPPGQRRRIGAHAGLQRRRYERNRPAHGQVFRRIGRPAVGLVLGLRGWRDVDPAGPDPYLSSADVYDVTLTVSNAFGSATLTKPNYITVTDPGTVDFEALPTSGAAPLIDVQFTDLSADNPTAWAWDFGDGGTSAIQNPKHTFSSPGPYTVSLTVTTSAGGGTAVKTDYINVSVGLCQVPDFIGQEEEPGAGTVGGPGSPRPWSSAGARRATSRSGSSRSPATPWCRAAARSRSTSDRADDASPTYEAPRP